MSVRRQGAVFHCNKLDLSRTKELSFVEHALKETLHIHAQNVVKKLLGYVYKILAKLGCVVKMVVESILPHVESGPNDHRKAASQFS